MIYSKSWQEGVIPEDWKQAEVKFLKKSGKASYHSASAYRPISLTSCLGKGLERIITQRLYAVCEHNKIIDRDQEGFRRFRSCTHAILHLVQDVCNGFNDEESTVAVLIDMEKACDSVWREGLLFKLFNMGIVGRVWQWIFAFLQDKKAACILQEYKSPVFATNIGLPQGSAPLLFNLFIADIYKEIGCERVKYADDGTIWRKGKNIIQVGELLEEDMVKIFKWTSQWRMKLSIEKTEVCVFSRDKELLANLQLDIKINGKKSLIILHLGYLEFG